jgi:hypothetical protein
LPGVLIDTPELQQDQLGKVFHSTSLFIRP